MSIRKKSKAVQYIEKLRGKELTLGELLHSIRITDEYTQVEMAKMLGLSKSHLCDIEKERRFVSPEKAGHFAEVLGYSPTHFIALCLQDQVRKSGYDLIIHVEAA